MMISIAGCTLSSPPDERLHSTLWVQTSAEYAVSTRQVFRMAVRNLDAALADPTWNALPDGAGRTGRPPSIIVDVDETILDNSGHTARMILARQGFTTESWRAWVREASAPAVPGAVEYLRAAADRGITIFYVTNRHRSLEADTYRNLAAVGCPLAGNTDVLLMREERPDWGHDKTSRREFVGDAYRVLQVVGDDLADFVAVPRGIADEERLQLAARHRERWGSSWFLLPNPMYGSWEQALVPGGVSLFNRPIEEKIEHLEPR